MQNCYRKSQGNLYCTSVLEIRTLYWTDNDLDRYRNTFGILHSFYGNCAVIFYTWFSVWIFNQSFTLITWSVLIFSFIRDKNKRKVICLYLSDSSPFRSLLIAYALVCASLSTQLISDLYILVKSIKFYNF